MAYQDTAGDASYEAKAAAYAGGLQESVDSANDFANTLRSQFPNQKIPSRALPNWLVKMMSYFDAPLKTVVKDLGFKHNMSNAKAKQQLNWSQRPEEETILDTAQSLIKQGAIKL